MVDYRRHFHRCLEVSNEEVQTRAYIKEELKKLGLSPKFDFHEEAMMNAMTIVYQTALQDLHS